MERSWIKPKDSKLSRKLDIMVSDTGTKKTHKYTLEIDHNIEAERADSFKMIMHEKLDLMLNMILENR